jgi:hypothetical protein
MGRRPDTSRLQSIVRINPAPTANQRMQNITYARSKLRVAQEKIDLLNTINPILIDASLRESAAGSRLGQPLDAKIDLFTKLKRFGFSEIILGSLNYAMQDEPQVDDDFMIHLRDRGFDLSGCYALTDVGHIDEQDNYVPSSSEERLLQYGIPNTLHEIYLSDFGTHGKHDWPTLKRTLPQSIDWLNTRIESTQGTRPQIIVNIVDGCDAFNENIERTVEALELLATLPIHGVSLEDDRGTFLPFQIGAFFDVARHTLPTHQKLLAHIHGGSGFENASVIEALLAGADGVWAALPKIAAVSGHASLGELFANLLRVGNKNISSYRLHELYELVASIHQSVDGTPIPDETPFFGSHALRLPLDFFRQREDRPQDLPADRYGATLRHRINPVVSDPIVLAARLSEVTQRASNDFDRHTLEEMIRVMRRDLRADITKAYDDPPELLDLYQRAQQSVIDANSAPSAHSDNAKHTD